MVNRETPRCVVQHLTVPTVSGQSSEVYIKREGNETPSQSSPGGTIRQRVFTMREEKEEKR